MKRAASTRPSSPPAGSCVDGGRAAGPWPAPTAEAVTRSPSPPTWASPTPSTTPLAAFAVTYADVNDHDHQTLAAAVQEGKLQAVNDL